MKALTIRQPWASAIFFFGKDIENRSWGTDYRGPLLIHAAGTLDTGFWESPEWRSYKKTAGCSELAQAIRNVSTFGMPRSCVIGTAELIDVSKRGCLTKSAWANRGQHHWQLRKARVLLQPVSCKGRLKLWAPSETLQARVRLVQARESLFSSDRMSA